jgi:putative CocE/NonD family hydrolase
MRTAGSKHLRAALCAAVAVACAHSRPDVAWYSPVHDASPARSSVYTSRYLTLRDGTRIAIDLHLPSDLHPDERIPTIVRQTRYWRSVQLTWLGRLLEGDPYDWSPLSRAARKDFVAHGYAWVDVDVRGTGASFGTQLCPFSPDEIRDGNEVVNWIVGQPWSNGKVGALGVSYDGSAADFLLVNRNPAVKAIAPLFAFFDAYTEIGFPGGTRLASFTASWGRVNNALDRNAVSELRGPTARIVVDAVHPVAGADAATLAAAVRDHARNYDVDAGAREITFRDDVSSQDHVNRQNMAGHPTRSVGSIGVFSTSWYADDLRASGAAIYSYSGWFDGGYPHAAVKRFRTVRNPGSRLTLGPWNHGARMNVGPPDGPRPSTFDHVAELRRFFDAHLKDVDTGIDREKPVHYFTIVEGRWKDADDWPVPATRVAFFLSESRGLSATAPAAAEGSDAYRVDETADTGTHARWNTLVGGLPVEYPDRGKADEKLLVYDSPPLGSDTEVTGHPLADLFIRSTATDGTFFVYLEDVDPSGRVTYVTEGELRALDRKLSDDAQPWQDVVPFHTFERKDGMALVPGEVAELRFGLLPTSYLFLKGHSIRVAIAGADAGHFAPVTGPATITLERNRVHASEIVLPVVAR